MNKIIELNKYGNKKSGYLSFFEDEDFSFKIKRIYYLYDVPINSIRGFHAHKKLKQILWCPYGVIDVVLDDGTTKSNFLLDSPEKILLINKGYWREIFFKENNSVLCVAASELFDEVDYIRDYDEYLKFVREVGWKNED